MKVSEPDKPSKPIYESGFIGREVEVMTGVTDEHLQESNKIEGVMDSASLIQAKLAWASVALLDELKLEDILDAHRILMLNQPLRASEKGQLRTVSVMVGGRVCPYPGELRDLLDKWLADMRNFAEFEPKNMHVRFEGIHPFIDGNGRIGRMLFWWHQAKVGQKPMLIKADKRWDYYRWFE